jgi:hypothetical protein
MSGRGRRRSVLPLPEYTLRKPLAGGRWGYYFNPPRWARKPDDRGPCPVGAEALGSDYAVAVERVEKVLLPLFDSWRTRGVIDLVPTKGTQRGTLDWLFSVYRTSPPLGGRKAFKKLSSGMQRLHEQGFRLVGDYQLKGGRRLGDVKLGSIDSTIADKLYDKLLPLRDEHGNLVPLPPQDPLQASLPDHDGEPLFVERRTTVNHAMRSCRRAWNVALRLHPKEVPAINPFATMGLADKRKEVEAATYADLLAAVAQADAMGLPSLGTAMMVTWEWLQREEHIFTAFRLDHYRPRKRPNEVFIIDTKTGEDRWLKLFDQNGAPRCPELMERMDAMKRNRIGDGLFFMRDWVDRRAKVPVPWGTRGGQLRMVVTKTREVLDACGIDPAIPFTSFRHGGMTELGDSDLTDTQIRAVSRHKSAKVLTRYVKQTDKQIDEATRKRRANRPAPSADESQLELFAGGQAGPKRGAKGAR